MSRSNNLFLRNNQGSTILRCLKNCTTVGGVGQQNYSFMENEIIKAYKMKQVKMFFLLKKMQEQGKVKLPNKYVVREIMKYVDGK